MKVMISGINGYLGKLVALKINEQGHHVSGIQRSLLYGSTAMLANEIKGSDTIINLSGASILRRWNRKNKQLIYDSRIKTTQNLIAAINMLPEEFQPESFISSSAIGIYKSGEKHNESSTDYDDGFLGKVVRDWEESLNKLPKSTNTVIFRIGPVLGKTSKTISNLELPFKLGLGGRIASGKQSFPFIHEKDVANAFLWAMEKPALPGIYNLVAPEKITNSEYTKALAQVLHRPAFIPVPAFLLKLMFGEAAIMLTKSPIAEPKALVRNGFQFEYPYINSALKNIFK